MGESMSSEVTTAMAASSFDYWTACAIFVLCFALIISEKVHKTKVALAGAAMVLVLALVSQEEAFHSPVYGVDYNVIFLLIAMMIIVNTLGRSGAFEWTAVKLAKAAKGKPFAIMATFFAATAIVSALLDNVTTVLLFVPVTLLITEQLDLDPEPFLIGEALASNIGGTATLIGDPPNIMIASRAKLGFMDFVIHLAPVVVIMMVAFLLMAWLFFSRRLKVSPERQAQVLAMSEDRLIKDRALLIKAGVVLAVTIVGFVLHGLLHLEPATIALFGASILLLVSRLNPHDILAEIEWTTLFFFIGLFIIIGAVVKVGLIADLSQFVINLTQPTETSMLTTAMVILWFSGLLSAVIDNIPYVATMGPLVNEMAGKIFHGGAPGTDLPLEVLQHPVLMPVWWSLALGACLGGNGTAIGASANVVVLGIAERSGHKVSFVRFMAYGVPVTLMTLVVATIYVYLRYY
jgi:Na+/H+ antiporter NhaD/arsenite permease-like protein